jgi:hypothetical protein
MEVKTDKIVIHYSGGSHGNYLEFMCNKFFSVMDPAFINFSPFDPSINNWNDSTAHTKPQDYYSNRVFYEFHQRSFNDLKAFHTCRKDRAVCIVIDPRDLLQYLQRIVNLTGEFENGTYYRCVLSNDYFILLPIDRLNKMFADYQIRKSYKPIKDLSWPEIDTLEDYYNLPKLVLEECQTVHNLSTLELSESISNCPRAVLREFFKNEFKTPEKYYIIVERTKKYERIKELHSAERVHEFNFASLYNVEQFKEELHKLAEFSGLDLNLTSEFYDIHNTFLSKNPHSNSKEKCDVIVDDILNTDKCYKLSLTMLEESYVNARLESVTGKIMTVYLDQYFDTTQDVRECLDSQLFY